MKTQDLLKQMLGKTFAQVLVESDKTAMHFVCDEGTFTFHHEQDCCESVFIEDIVGDVTDLEGTPLLNAEEVSGEIPADYERHEYHESSTWTFYKFATIKGYLDVRWLGESNGYYSESVDMDFEPCQTAATNPAG